MKTTFKYIFAIVSLFAFSSAAFAQSGEGEEPEQKYEGVHAEKSATYDFTTQKGEITLESFVEGFIKPAESKPLDVIYVWDNSSCMNGNIGGKSAQLFLGDIVKDFVRQVQEKVPGSRFGLVTFSKNASVECELTEDSESFGFSLPSKTDGGNPSGNVEGLTTGLGEFTPRADGKETQKVLIFLSGCHGFLSSDIVKTVAKFKQSGGLVVTVVIPDRGATTDEIGYMEHASSNWPNATDYDDEHIGEKGDPAIYALNTKEPEDLGAFFDALAKSITKVPDMGPTVMTKDVLSPSFKLPAGTTLDDISAYAVPCTEVVFDASGEITKYEFTSDKSAWKTLDILEFTEGQTYTEEKDITKVKVYAKLTTSSEGNDQLELTGFDYKTFFCGPVYSDSGSKTDPKGKKYDVVGYKFVITLPIVLSSGNAASLTTNTEESGLYAQNGDQIAFFPLPEVYFAYITIKKEGLAAGESALFKVSRTSGSTTTEICQVALTGDGKGTVSKGVYAGMFAPGDTYTVAELTEWGWTYNLSGMKLEVGDAEIDDGIFEMIADDPTTEKVEGNEGKNAVFTFTNAKKEGITVKNAENAKLNHLVVTAATD